MSDHETPAERRLRELSKAFTEGTPTHDVIDAGREALALLRKLTNEVTVMLALAEVEIQEAAGLTNVEVLKYCHKGALALLARCGEDA